MKRIIVAIMFALFVPIAVWALNVGAPPFGLPPGYSPVTPANGGLGAGTSAPAWLRTFGDGNEGAFNNTATTLTGEHWYTTFVCSQTVANTTVNTPLIIRATTSITLNSGCNLRASQTTVVPTDIGGTGGSGGGGTAASALTTANSLLGNGAHWTLVPGAAASAASGGAGNIGGAMTAANQQVFASGLASEWMLGGESGSAGGSAGGAAGSGTEIIILVAPTITINSGATVVANGFTGTTTGTYTGSGASATANTQGGGGGGGGGVIMMAAESYPTFAGVVSTGGGYPGSCTAPSVTLQSQDTTGSGAFVTVTGVTAGGMDASKISITAGTNYTVAPVCVVVPNGSGIINATCTATIATGGVSAITFGVAGTGATFSSFTTCGIGGYGGAGWFKKFTIQ